MSFRLVIFLGSIVLIIFSMHWLFFRSIIRFFSITAPLHKTALYTAMVLLTAVVISGFMAARAHETWWITGDILDGMGGKWHGELALVLDDIKADNGVFYVTGNHEGYIGEQRAVELLGKTTMTRLDNRLVEINGLEIMGISYPGIHSTAEIAGLPEGGKKGGDAVRILLFHTPTSVLRQEGDSLDHHFYTYWMPDITFSCNRKLHIDLQLSGHTHHGQLFPANLVTRLLYRGFDYGLNKSGGSWIYTTSGAGTWGPPMRTATISEIAVIRLREKP